MNGYCLGIVCLFTTDRSLEYIVVDKILPYIQELWSYVRRQLFDMLVKTLIFRLVLLLQEYSNDEK